MTDYPQVKSGDLIKAELINQILTDLHTLKTKVATLEGGGIAAGAPIIESLSPWPEVRIGEPLQITGRNLAPSESTITVGGEVVTQMDMDNSSDELLVFTVPTILGIPSGGKPVPVIVSHSKGQATASIVVKPGGAADLLGSLTVNPATPPAQTITAGNSFTWVFPTRVISSRAASYVVSAAVDVATWKVELLELSGAVSVGNSSMAELAINQSPPSNPSDFDFKVQVTVPAGAVAGDKAELTLTIKAKEKETFNSSAKAPIEVGTAPQQPPTDVVITLGDVIPPDAKVEGKLVIAANQSVVAKFNIVVKEAGDHILEEFQVENDPGGHWTATVATSMTNNEFHIPMANQPFPLDTIVSPKAGAPTTKLHILVTNKAGTKSGELDQDLELKS